MDPEEVPNQPRKRRRYKTYGDPEKSNIPIPRTTSWRFEKESVDHETSGSGTSQLQCTTDNEECNDIVRDTQSASFGLMFHNSTQQGTAKRDKGRGESLEERSAVEHFVELNESETVTHSDREFQPSDAESLYDEQVSNDECLQVDIEHHNAKQRNNTGRYLSPVHNLLDLRQATMQEAHENPIPSCSYANCERRAATSRKAASNTSQNVSVTDYVHGSKNLPHDASFLEDDERDFLSNAHIAQCAQNRNLGENQMGARSSTNHSPSSSDSLTAPSDSEDSTDEPNESHPADDYIEDISRVYDDEEGDEPELSDDQDPGENLPPDQPGHLAPQQLPQQAQLKEKLRSEYYSERITTPVIASRFEILLNIQEFCALHPQPLTAQEDLHRLMNTLFQEDIIPESKYKLDKLYSSEIKITYLFFCTNCFKGFGELDYKRIQMKVCSCGTSNPVSNLTKASFFVIIDIVGQLQLLLDNPDIFSQLKSCKDLTDNGEMLLDIYDGLMYKKFAASLDLDENISYISLTGCTDGTPLFQSSTLSIWPLFVSVNELPPLIRMSNILISGLWFGRSHPKMDLFLEAFSDYMRGLSDNGFYLTLDGNVRFFKAYLIACCVDSGARGAVQCVHSHNGESSCNWCLQPGEVEGDGSNARKFPVSEVQSEKRTMRQMIQDGAAVLQLTNKNAHINGVIGVSPLLRAPKFDIVDGMVLDFLHWGAFGIARRMVKLWLGETKKKKSGQKNRNADLAYYIGTEETKAVINKRISNFHPPMEVRRMPRDLTQVHTYNAREYENIILYFGLPMFKSILPDRFLKHFLLFVQACYLLLKFKVTKTEVEMARHILFCYVSKVEELYGRSELTYNMHLSLHAADNVMRWSSLWCISTFAFENGNKTLKSKIHSERGIPHQIIRSLHRDTSLGVLRNVATTPQTASYRNRIERKEVQKSFYVRHVCCLRPSEFIPTQEELWQCQQLAINPSEFLECNKIIVKNVCYGLSRDRKTDNSVAYCSDKRIVKVRKIIASESLEKVLLFVSRMHCTPYGISGVRLTSPISPFMYTVDIIEEETKLISFELLETICVNLQVNDQFLRANYVSIMPYTVNKF